MRLTVTETGKDRAGTPLVLLHAFPFDSRMWHHQLTELYDEVRVVALNMRGFGQPLSNLLALESLRAASPTIGDYASDVLETLDELKIKKAVIGGCSMGGYVAFELWRRAPERIAGLVLCDTRAEPDTEEAKENRAKQSERIRLEGLGFIADIAVNNLIGPTMRGSLEEFARQVVQTQAPVAVQGALAVLAGRPDSKPTLASITVPTLIVVGEDDGVTPPEMSETMHAGISGSTLVKVPRAGHLAPLEQPRAVNESIRQFLGTIK